MSRGASGTVATALSVPFAAITPAVVASSRRGITLPCFMRDHLGVPCPFCGVTRAADAVWSGAAPTWPHVPAQLLLLTVVAMAAYATFGMLARRTLPTARVSLTYLAVVGLLGAGNWAVQLNAGPLS